MVISCIAILSIVVLEFSKTSRIHLDQGVNIRDEYRAITMADTALIMTRACLDPKAWPGPMAQLQNRMDLKRLCDLMLGIFVGGRVDLPFGGLSVELEGIEGVGLASGSVEEIELTTESSYIGLAGLHCLGKRQAINCGSRTATVGRLRALLCEPEVAHIFEHEQADGHRYTREEIIGNLIDWVDDDDNRIQIDISGALVEGAGEGEDAYLRSGDHDFRSKDEPFDSIEELRLVRGVNDELFDFLKDKVSAHSSGKIDVNSASAEVIAAMLRSHSPYARRTEQQTCGQDSDTGDQIKGIYASWGRMIVAAREAKQADPERMLSKPYRRARTFIKDARDPLTAIQNYRNQTAQRIGNALGMDLGGGGQDPMQRGIALMSFRFGGFQDPNQALLAYENMRANPQFMDWRGLGKSVATKSNIFRLKVRGRVGDMTRSLFAILKKDGQTVRTLYYREE